MKKIFFYTLLAVMIMSCGGKKTTESEGSQPPPTSMFDEFKGLHGKARKTFGALPVVAESANNPITNEKVELGKMLYFDNRLSKDNTQSCNTCHNVNTFGVDNKSKSEGNNGGLGTRNSPTVFNAALHMAQFWDGREPDVEAQAGGPIVNPLEMAMPSETAVVARLSGIAEYKKLFAKAFPEDASPVTYDNLKKAIGAYERKMITPSKFDDYMGGDDNALTSEEKKGLQTFMDSGCVTCHSGNLLGGTMFQKFGLYGDYWEYTKSDPVDNGKFDVTGNEADKYIFKVPSLRNVEKTGPYFHDGSVENLGEAIKIMAKVQVDKDLTDQEVSEIEVFLNSLTADIPVTLKQ